MSANDGWVYLHMCAVTSSDFHNSNLFSEHLGTHRTLELWPQFIYI